MLESNIVNLSEEETTVCSHCGKVISVDDVTETASGDYVCEECLDEYFTQCDDCGEYCPKDSLIETGNGDKVCADCLDNDYFKCDDCGEYFKTEDGHNTSNGDTVCDDCIDSYYAWCEECEEWVSSDDIIAIETRNGDTKYVCRDCAEHNYYKCDNCGEYHDAEGVVTDSYGHCLCYSCFNDGYDICAHCGEIISYDESWYDEEAGESYCYGCYQEHNEAHGLHDYSYKPSAVFHAMPYETSRLFEGKENELSFDSIEDRNAALEIIKRILNRDNDEEPVVYCKTDSSLKNGLEMVFHPRTLDSWSSLQPKLAECFKELRSLTDGQRDGLHVHISKKAMSDAHKVRFGSFFAAFKDEIEIIARRSECHWASYGSKPSNGQIAKVHAAYNNDRYHAVNWQNAATVEIRIFRSTLDVTEFLSADQFCHAVYQFTKHHCSIVDIIRKPVETWQAFLAYVKTDSRYAELLAFMRNAFEKRIANNDTLSGGRLQAYLATLNAKGNGHGNKAKKRIAQVA